jgi:hypothetical protein
MPENPVKNATAKIAVFRFVAHCNQLLLRFNNLVAILSKVKQIHNIYVSVFYNILYCCTNTTTLLARVGTK